ncbi:hypothetical protein L7F22_062904 [Adiantum nelumboides]|nr:hypothetical protein [Adiantum nelumboides]
MQFRCFHGTDEECIKSWIARVEEEMMHLDIVDDGAKADFASHGLSYDAFVFMHMLPDDWRHSWLALKFSLLMRYWRLPKPTDPIESSLVATFESLQDEFWEMLQSPFDVDAYHDDNVCCLSDLHAERGLQMVDDALVKFFDGDDVSESGYCSNFESDDYSVSLFSADEFVDGTPCDGAFADGESSCDDPVTFNPFWYMGDIKTKCPDQAHSVNERDQLTGSLPLAIDADDCEQSDDAFDTYAKYNVVFVDDQPLSHDKGAFDQGFGQPASMHRDLDIRNVGSSQTPSVDTFTDDEADWGFDLPVVEMDADMTSYVEKAFERLQILKSQRETDQACNHGMVNTLFFSEVEGAGNNKKESNGQQIPNVSGSGVFPSEVDSGAEFGHVCTGMVSWSEADNESKQKGQSNGSMSVLALEVKVKEDMIFTLETQKAEEERIDNLEREVSHLRSRVDEVLKEETTLQEELAESDCRYGWDYVNCGQMDLGLPLTSNFKRATLDGQGVTGVLIAEAEMDTLKKEVSDYMKELWH